jgi:hypothetical protein
VKHHFSMYAESIANLTNTDITLGTPEDVLQARNSHLIFSERFNLIAANVHGLTLTAMRFGNVSLQTYGIPHLWPINTTDLPPDRPAMIDYRDYPMPVPMNEELTLEATTTGVGPQVVKIGLWLAKPDWNRNLPQGIRPLQVRATATIGAASTTTWSALAPLVMERDLGGGVYACVGAHCFLATGSAFRIFFPNQPLAEGRQLRPGGLIQNAAGTTPWEGQHNGLGEWGRFSTFELPSVQCFGSAAGGTAEVRLSLVYLGNMLSLLYGR